MRSPFFHPAHWATALLCVAAAGAAQAQAQLIDDFRSGGANFLWPDTPLPAGGVFEATGAAAVPGGRRYTAMQPSAVNGPSPFAYASLGGGVLYVTRAGMPALTVSLGYGMDAPLNLDLSGQDALRLQLRFASTIQYGTGYFGPDSLGVTIYATTSRGAGLNPDGSAAEVLLASNSTTDVPFSSFFTNASTGVPVNWGDVDSLLFVFNDSQREAHSSLWILESISAVPEPAGGSLFAAGALALLALRRRRRVALAGALALSGSAAMAGDLIVNIQGFGNDGAGTLSPQSYPLAAGTVIALTNPVLVPLPAGSYSLSDAWGLPGALYDTWNFQRDEPGSWLSHYVAALPRPDGHYEVLVDGVSLQDPGCGYHFCAWATRAEAAAAFAATPAYGFTLASAGTVAFVSADYFLPDNLGGISLLVTPVPEPAPAALLLAGIAALAWLQRCRGGAR